jgi:sterol desaturase/sphingolipid hydroxylase (fatty acid hydroxylase superfamily)
MLLLFDRDTPFHVIALLEWLDNFLRYAIVAGLALLVFWGLFRERLRGRLIQRSFPAGRHLVRELGWSVSTAAVFALAGVVLFYGVHAGIFRVYLDPAERGWAWIVLSSALLVVLQDTYFYWTHRAMHHPRLFKLFHRVHHLSTKPSPLAAYAFAPAEAAVHAVFVLLVTPWLPVHPIALGIWLTFMIVRNVLGHLGMELLPGWLARHPLLSWMTTTTHHDLHHRRVRTNFGLYFTFWDEVMGTTDPRYDSELEEVTSRGGRASPTGGVSLSSPPS